jgi:HPt (histidine-containing phosphotransfer) domain-containing protein
MKNDQEVRTIKGLLGYALDYFLDTVQTIKWLFAEPATPAESTANPLPEDDLELDLDSLDRSFSSELFARLLLELPAHRRSIADAYKSNDSRQLGAHIHRLLGSAAYCDAPQLVSGLRELRLALKTGDRKIIDFYYTRAIDVIDSTLRFSGYTGEPPQ